MAAADLDLLDLARALVTLPLFEWRRGMLAANGWRVVWRYPGGLLACAPETPGSVVQRIPPEMTPGPLWLPDLSDPATLGALYAALAAVGGQHDDE